VLSAGEAQRVRLARALLRQRARLVILDEPFLGLERDRRRALLTNARGCWAKSTLLYVTHDIAETRAFDRVLVMEHGRIVEDGVPTQLARTPASRYRRLLQAHEAMHNRLAASSEWRRLRFESGRVVAEHTRTNEQTA
jgi:ATP-binding cassette subfamily B protein